MFEARNVNFADLPEDKSMHGASGDGRRFAISGGVAQAVVNVIANKYPDREVKIEHAEGLDNCRKMLLMAKKGKLNGCLLEGMACPGGCVGGAGTVQPIPKSTAAVNKHVKQSTNAHAYNSNYQDMLHDIEEGLFDFKEE